MRYFGKRVQQKDGVVRRYGGLGLAFAVGLVATTFNEYLPETIWILPLRQFVDQTGMALLIAAALGLVIEGHVRRRTTEAVVTAVEGRILERHDELLEEYRYVREIEWVRKDCKIRLQFAEDSRDARRPLTLTVTMRYEVANYSGKRIDYTQKISVSGTPDERQQIVRLVGHGSDLDHEYDDEPDETESGQTGGRAAERKVKIKYTGREPDNEFIQVTQRIAEMNDVEVISVNQPTLGLQVEVEGVSKISGLNVEVYFGHRLRDEAKEGPGMRWELRKLFLPGSGAYVNWAPRPLNENQAQPGAIAEKTQP